MSEKTLKSRIIHKHDIEANWKLATNFSPLEGEIIIYDPDENNPNPRIKIGDGTTNVNDLAFYAGSWNDIEGKPFGETVTYSDTLTWDGNTEGLEYIDPLGNKYMLIYLVSEVAPTVDDFNNGAVLNFNDGDSIIFSADDLIDYGNGVLTEENFWFASAQQDNLSIELKGIPVIFPKKGLYVLVYTDGKHLTSLTINGYNGFETTEIQTIDPKYLPETVTHAISADMATHATTADSATESDTLDGKHASDFALATDLDAVEALVGDTSVADQISNATENYYTKIEIDEYELITIADIDEVCNGVTEGSLAQSDVDELMAQLQ